MLSRIVEESEARIALPAWRKINLKQPESAMRGNGPAPRAPETAHPPGPTPAQIDALVQQQSRQARDAGYREGEAAGRSKAEEQLRETVAGLAAAAAEIAATRQDALQRAEADVVRLAVEIARRILHRELSIDTGALEGLIRAALGKLAAQEVYRVRIHPEHETLMRACLQQLGRGAQIETIPDPLQARGGVVFEVTRGMLDASVETQLREIERGLADQLEVRA